MTILPEKYLKKQINGCKFHLTVGGYNKHTIFKEQFKKWTQYHSHNCTCIGYVYTEESHTTIVSVSWRAKSYQIALNSLSFCTLVAFWCSEK